MTTRPRSNSPHHATAATRRLPGLVGVTLLAALLLGACSSGELRITPPDDQPANFSLFAEVPGDQVTTSTSPAFAVVVDDGANTLRISEARVVVNQVEFGRDSGECVDSNNLNDGDACSEVQQDPSLPSIITLPVEQQAVNLTPQPIGVEPGNYDRLELDLHPVTNQDGSIIAQGFRPGSSVRIRGTINGQALTDESGAAIQFGPEASLELSLGDSFPLAEGENGAITLVVDVASWFRDGDGSVIDPRDAAADPELKAVVEQNIIESMQATPGLPESNEF